MALHMSQTIQLLTLGMGSQVTGHSSNCLKIHLDSCLGFETQSVKGTIITNKLGEAEPLLSFPIMFYNSWVGGGENPKIMLDHFLPTFF